MSADFRITRIKAANKGVMTLLGETVLLAQEHVPKLRKTAENRVTRRNMEDTLTQLGSYCRKNGFDPTRTLQHVANYDTEVWTLVLQMFAKYDDEGNFMDDGLLYKWDMRTNNVALNKDFFYALLSYFEALGIPCDMRGKITVN